MIEGYNLEDFTKHVYSSTESKYRYPKSARVLRKLLKVLLLLAIIVKLITYALMKTVLLEFWVVFTYYKVGTLLSALVGIWTVIIILSCLEPGGDSDSNIIYVNDNTLIASIPILGVFGKVYVSSNIMRVKKTWYGLEVRGTFINTKNSEDTKSICRIPREYTTWDDLVKSIKKLSIEEGID